jgi:hypothetical protein
MELSGELEDELRRKTIDERRKFFGI